FRQLRLAVAAVVGELDRLALPIRQLSQGVLHAFALQAQPGVFMHVAAARFGRRLERLGAAALLATDDVDRPSVNEHQDPAARLPAFGRERRRGLPDSEERLLDGVLRKRLVPDDALREPIGNAAVAVIQLRERALVRARHQHDERLVGEMGEAPAHNPCSSARWLRFAARERESLRAVEERAPAPVEPPRSYRVADESAGDTVSARSMTTDSRA